MDSVVEDWSGTHGTTRSTPPNSSDLSSKRQKKIVDDLFSVANWEEGINFSKFGTVTQEIQALLARRAEMMKPFLRKVYIDASPRKEDLPAHHPIINVDDDIAGNSIAAQSLIIIDSDDDEKPKNQMLSQPHQNTVVKNPTGEVPLEHSMEGDYAQGQNCQILMVGDASLSMESNSTKDMKGVHVGKEDGREGKGEFTSAQGKTLIEGDASLVDESKSKKCAKSLYASQEDGSSKGKGEYVGVEDMEIEEENQQTLIEGDASLVDESKSKKCAKSLYASQEDGSSKGKGEYVGVEDMEIEEENQQTDANFDGLADIWKEMNFGLECSKDIVPELTSNESKGDGGEDCNEHSYIFKDDLGYVCRICGVISKKIETIIEYQYPKSTRSTRTYHYEGRTAKDGAVAEFNLDGTRVSENDFSGAEIYAHPRHKKQMKPHQVEGFNFLLSNLVTEIPGGCILAHAPGSGKTFMLICFLQSFMAKYPSAKPLVILPVGILPTWKKEFKRWQIEDFQLFDFYSVKAENRSQQLVVLNQWMDQRSILFLGYKQFSSIICDSDTGKITTKCQDILLTCPSILIMDEGHTPRNQDTDVLTSLEKVQTPRKVVLSGTLYQNHVKEVFNILNLVRPRFLKLETSKSIKKRILSRVSMSSKKNTMIKGTDNEFYDLVELTLVKDDNFKRKVTVIEDLREMTSKVLHYYKGDFLDELPGLVDFSVFLDLSPKQKREVSMLRKSAQKFKMSSDGSAIYVHPKLKSLTKNPMVKDRVDEGKIDELLAKLDLQDGVKAKFFLNLLNLCESGGEKLLVFGQYLLPLKFLERLAMKVKGWSPGKEIFMITGDSDSAHREISMDSFNSSSDARVFFGSIKACGEGISLVGASRIIILDVHLNPSVTRQAIGRAFRPGQERKVYTYRLVAANAPEEEDHYTCFRKESISKMWFEWDEYCGHNEFEMEKADVSDCGDQFLETSRLNEDVVALYKR